jgi:outer membrane protein assembly factor BamB
VIPPAPVIAKNGEYICAGTTDGEVRAFSAGRGRTVWYDSLDSPIVAEPLIVQGPESDPVLYIMESETGTLRAYWADTGERMYTVNCVEWDSEDCTLPVEAEMR